MPKRKGTIGGRSKKVTGAKKYGLKKASTPRRAPAPMSAKGFVRRPPKMTPIGGGTKGTRKPPRPKRPTDPGYRPGKGRGSITPIPRTIGGKASGLFATPKPPAPGGRRKPKPPARRKRRGAY